MRAQRRGVRGRGTEEGRLVEQRVTHATVTPVEEDESVRVASNVARVEVPVDERVRQPARCDRRDAGRQVGRECAEDLEVGGIGVGGTALDQVGDGHRQRRSAPIRETQREQPGHVARGLGLEGDEQVDHPVELGWGRVMAIAAGQLRHEDAMSGMAEQGRDRSTGQPLQDGALVGEERRDRLEPRRRPVGQRQGPQAGQVPRPDLPGCRHARAPGGGEDVVGPAQVGRRTTGSRPRHPTRMIDEPAGPRLERHTSRPRARSDLGQVGDAAAVDTGAIDLEESQDRDVQAEPFAGALDDRPRLGPPRDRHLERGQDAERRIVAPDQDEADLARRR